MYFFDAVMIISEVQFLLMAYIRKIIELFSSASLTLVVAVRW